MCFIDNISYSLVPPGVSSFTKSPSDFPTRLLDKGEFTDIVPNLTSASSSPTIL